MGWSVNSEQTRTGCFRAGGTLGVVAAAPIGGLERGFLLTASAVGTQ